MVIFFISLTGLPPTAGFIGKLYLFAALIDGGWSSSARNPKLTVVGAMFKDARFEKLGGNKFRLRAETKGGATLET